MSREKVIKHLSNLLGDSDIATCLEAGLFNRASAYATSRGWSDWSKASTYYSTLAVSFIYNLKDVGNGPIFKAKITMDNAQRIGETWNSYDMNPTVVDSYTEEKRQLEERKQMEKDRLEALSKEAERLRRLRNEEAIFTCPRCKSGRTEYYEMQTRSADEPATVFITCLDCSKRWRR